MTETQNIAETLPFANEQLKGFRSSLQAPEGKHSRRMVAAAVDRIVQGGEDKRAQAMATLTPDEREFVAAVVKEFYTWAAQQQAARMVEDATSLRAVES